MRTLCPLSERKNNAIFFFNSFLVHSVCSVVMEWLKSAVQVDNHRHSQSAKGQHLMNSQ